MSVPFERGGQPGWAHGPGGRFHTYDDLDGRPVHLRIPPGEGPAPLLLFHDGDAVFWPGGAFHKTWGVPEVLDTLGGTIRQPLVVAVPPRDRAYEYTHVDWADGTRPWGGLDGYTAWLADRLLPWIRRNYKVDPGPVTVVGSSHGGLAALYNVAARPDTFGAAGAMSPSLWVEVDGWETPHAPLPLREGALLRLLEPVLRERRPKLWLCWGLVREGGFHNARTEALATVRGRELAALCEEVGYRRQDLGEGGVPGEADVYVHEDPAGSHDEESWRRRLPGVMRALLRG